MWRSSFVATSVALGATVDEALASLGGTPDAALAAVARGLASEERAVRLATLTEALTSVVRAVEEVALA